MSFAGTATVDADTVATTRLLQAARRAASAPGLHATAMKGVWAFRADAPTRPAVFGYRLSLCVTLQGRKRIYFGAEEIDYGAMNCLLVGLQLPLHAQVVEATAEQPCLAFVMELSPAVVRATAQELDDLCACESGPAAVHQFPARGALLDSVLRVGQAALKPSDAQMLGESLKREVVYRLLKSEQGGLLRSLASTNSGTDRVARVIRHINKNLARRNTVAEMAAVAHMSESSLHHVFKQVTSLSPMQYLKRLRLHRARALMVDTELNASQAALEVGYNSASQFSREFKALFGFPPSHVRVS